MGYFQVRYDSGVVIYNCRGFTRLATGAYDPSVDPLKIIFSIMVYGNLNGCWFLQPIRMLKTSLG